MDRDGLGSVYATCNAKLSHCDLRAVRLPEPFVNSSVYVEYTCISEKLLKVPKFNLKTFAIVCVIIVVVVIIILKRRLLQHGGGGASVKETPGGHSTYDHVGRGQADGDVYNVLQREAKKQDVVDNVYSPVASFNK
nr:hypothetical protein BaRGS_007600 [Batillaria attramentaria]